jgi:hypothetical protein
MMMGDGDGDDHFKGGDSSVRDKIGCDKLQCTSLCLPITMKLSEIKDFASFSHLPALHRGTRLQITLPSVS